MSSPDGRRNRGHTGNAHAEISVRLRIKKVRDRNFASTTTPLCPTGGEGNVRVAQFHRPLVATTFTHPQSSSSGARLSVSLKRRILLRLATIRHGRPCAGHPRTRALNGVTCHATLRRLGAAEFCS